MDGSLVLAMLSGKDFERVEREIRDIKRRYPSGSTLELVEKAIGRAAWRSALIAAAVSAPGGLGAGLPAAADFSYQTQAYNRLALVVAELERRPLTVVERAGTVAASFALAAAAEWLRRGAVRGARRATARGPAWLATLATAAAGAAVGYGVARAAGELAREVFGRRSRRGWLTG